MSLSNSMVLALTLEQRKVEVEKLHPRFFSEELDGLRSSDGGPHVMNAEPVGIVLDVADILQGIKLLSTDSTNGPSGWTNNLIKFFVNIISC